LSQFA
jgi:hypothetical protein